MNLANLNRKNRDATGIGACACARHGCFVPQAVVDFQKGERYALGLILRPHSIGEQRHNRQMNVDYAICNALKYSTAGLPQALVIYDIGCQWIINFSNRLRESQNLSIPEAMELLVAVGKFHLSAHVKECFALFSLNFVHGSGQLDGEILETLWAPFNFISSSARTMSMASRHAVYDDHMRDSNWKKIVFIGGCQNIQNDHGFTFSLLSPVSTLCKKFEKAKNGLKETSEAYEELSASLNPSLVKIWQADEQRARVERGDALKIYDVRFEQGGLSSSHLHAYHLSH